MKECPQIDIAPREFSHWELEDPLGLRQHIFERYGDIAKQVVGDLTNYLVMHPDYAQVIFNDKQDDFINRHPVIADAFEPIMGTQSLFVQNDPERWQRLRHLARMGMDVPSFFERYVNKSFEIGKSRVDGWMERCADGDLFDVSRELDCMVISFVNNSFFYYIEDRPEEIRELLYRTNEVMNARGTAEDPAEWSVPPKKTLFDETIEIFMETMRRWVRRRIESGRSIDDFMGVMIHELAKTSAGDDLVGETAYHVAMAVVASLFTTSPALHYLLIQLARHPAVAEKVREEIHQTVGDGTPTYEHFRKMNYCSAVIKESLRYNSSVHSVYRQATVDTSIGEYSIPKGSGVVVFTSVIHHDPRFWDRPGEFIPERFLDRPMGQDHLFAWLPFGAGRRACIARHFSPLEMVVALVLLARNLSFELIPDRAIKPYALGPGILTQPSEPHMILRKPV